MMAEPKCERCVNHTWGIMFVNHNFFVKLLRWEGCDGTFHLFGGYSFSEQGGKWGGKNHLLQLQAAWLAFTWSSSTRKRLPSGTSDMSINAIVGIKYTS